MANKYIDAEKLIAEIERRKELLENGTAHTEVMKRVEGALKGYNSILDIIASLQQERQAIIDSICSRAGISVPYKDGNQWCILKGDDIQQGVAGFGNTPEDALMDFIKNVPVQQKQPELNLEKEFNAFLDNVEGMPRMWHSGEQIEWAKDIARHFYELGRNARKGE